MSILLSLYVLIWPAIVAITLGVISVAVFRETRRARRDGQSLV